MGLISFGKLFSFGENAVDAVTGKRQSDIASDEQKKRMRAALHEYNTYSSEAPKFDNMQRSIVDEQATGKAAAVGDYGRTTATPMQNLYNASIQGNMNRSIGGSLGGTASRGVNRTVSQGITNANNEMYSRAQDMAGTMKQSALANLQAAASGRANIYQGMASNVQADPSILSRFYGAMNTYQNLAGASAKSS